jgi:tetratricopeptide (TPR) repeat protein
MTRGRSRLVSALLWAAAFLIAILPTAWFLSLFVHEHLHLLAYLAVTGQGGQISYFDDLATGIGLFSPVDRQHVGWLTYWAPWLETIALGVGVAYTLRRAWSPVIKVFLWAWFAVSAITQAVIWTIAPWGDAQGFQHVSRIPFRIVGIASSLAAIAPFLWMIRKAVRQRRRAPKPGEPAPPAAVSQGRHPVLGAAPILLLLGLAACYPFYVHYVYRYYWIGRHWASQEKAYCDAIDKGGFRAAQTWAEASLRTAKRMGVRSGYYVVSLTDMGDFYQKQGDFSRAEGVLERAVHIVERGAPADRDHLLPPTGLLALTCGEHGRFREAESHYKRALEIGEEIWGKGSPQNGVGVYDLGVLYREMGRYDEAERLIKEGLDLCKRADPKDETGRASILRNLGVLYLRQHRYVEARAPLQESLKIRERHYGKSHYVVALSLNSLAELGIAQRRLDEAGKLLARAMRIEARVLRPEHVQIAETLQLQAMIGIAQGDYHQAEPLLRRALQIRERALTPDHPDIARTLETYSALLGRTGRVGEAAKMASRAKTIRDKWAMAAPMQAD